MSLKKITLKLLLLMAVIISLHFAFKKITPKKEQLIAKKIKSSRKNEIYFIGSSRISLGIRSAIVESSLKNIAVYNMGSMGNFLLGNYLLMNSVLSLNKQQKIFIVEVSQLVNKNITEEVVKFTSNSECNTSGLIYEFIKQGGRKTITPCFMLADEFFLHKLSLREEVKSILDFKPVNFKEDFEETKTNINNVTSTLSMLRKEDLIMKSIQENNDYKDIINLMSKQAIQNNANLYFILPLTYKSEQEKKALVGIYQNIPNHLKIIYPDTLIDSMRDVSYLADRFHFNNTGAKKFSTLLIPIIKNIADTGFTETTSNQ